MGAVSSLQMITVLSGGVLGTPKSDNIIHVRPLTGKHLISKMYFAARGRAFLCGKIIPSTQGALYA